MKKLIIILLGLMGSQATFAASATANLTINGTLATSCTASMSTATVSLPDLTATTPATTSLQVTCRTGTSYSMTAASTNGWRLANGTNYLDYSIAYTGSTSGVSSAWSGVSGSTAPVNLTTANQTGDGTQQSYNLNVVNSAAPLTLPGGTYSDAVVFTITYS